MEEMIFYVQIDSNWIKLQAGPRRPEDGKLLLDSLRIPGTFMHYNYIIIIHNGHICIMNRGVLSYIILLSPLVHTRSSENVEPYCLTGRSVYKFNFINII